MSRTAAAILLAVTMTACGGGEDDAASRPHVSIYEGTTPQGSSLTRTDIEKLKDELNREAQGTPPALPMPADVFVSGSAMPDKASSKWTSAFQTLKEVRTAALENGWSILVEGYTDSSGSADFNCRLSQDRADVAASSAVVDAEYPQDRVTPVGRGVSAEDERKIVISFYRSDQSSAVPPPCVSEQPK